MFPPVSSHATLKGCGKIVRRALRVEGSAPSLPWPESRPGTDSAVPSTIREESVHSP